VGKGENSGTGTAEQWYSRAVVLRAMVQQDSGVGLRDRETWDIRTGGKWDREK
jgi:hypothetical protein